MTRLRAIVASYVGVLSYASFIFLAAWRLVYWQALLYVVVALIGATLSNALVPKGSGITVERAGNAAAGQTWDKRILGAYFLVSIATFVIAGLDSGRFGWTGPVPLGVTIAGVVLMLLGQVIFAVAKRQNEFFSARCGSKASAAIASVTPGCTGMFVIPATSGCSSLCWRSRCSSTRTGLSCRQSSAPFCCSSER